MVTQHTLGGTTGRTGVGWRAQAPLDCVTAAKRLDKDTVCSRSSQLWCYYDRQATTREIVAQANDVSTAPAIANRGRDNYNNAGKRAL